MEVARKGERLIWTRDREWEDMRKRKGVTERKKMRYEEKEKGTERLSNRVRNAGREKKRDVE